MSSLQFKTLVDQKMDYVNKEQIMQVTQEFNDSKMTDENSKNILVKLIYLFNQGMEFNEQELEILFFRLTKLFQNNNPRVRCMTYKLLKMIMPQKYVHFILQSLSKDLISDNPIIKAEALKFVPIICDEQNFQSVERFISNALLDPNLLVSSKALLVGIHIANKFPNFISKWLFDVVEKLDQLKENQQYHALILLYEIKKEKLVQFIKMIILLLNKELLPLVHFQIMKIIQEILPQLDNQYKKELIQYLFQQTRNQEPLICFESYKILVNNLEINNDELVTVNQQIEQYISGQSNNITIFCIMNLAYALKKRSLLTHQQIQCIKDLTFSSNLNQSLMGLLFLFQLKVVNIQVYLREIFDQQSITIKKLHFLHGIQEIIHHNFNYIHFVLEFLELTSYDYKAAELVECAIKIIEYILTISDQYKRQSIRVLRILARRPSSLKNNSKIIRLIISLLLNIQRPTIDDYKVIQWFEYMDASNFIFIDEVKLQLLKNKYITLESTQNCQNNQNRYK